MKIMCTSTDAVKSMHDSVFSIEADPHLQKKFLQLHFQVEIFQMLRHLNVLGFAAF